METDNKSVGFISWVCILLLYFAASTPFNEELNSISLYFAIPASFILSFYIKSKYNYKNIYVKWLIILYVWLGLTYFTAYDQLLAARELRRFLGCAILCVAIANLSDRSKNTLWLYGIYIIIFMAAIKYARDTFFVGTYNISNSRVNDRNLNANTLAYYTFFMDCTIFILGDLVKEKMMRKAFRLLFFLSIAATFYVAIFTASRQVLIINIPLFLFFIYLRYFRHAGAGRKFVAVMFLAIALIGVGGYALTVYNSSYLKVRSETKIKDDARTRLLKEAIAVGDEHPIIGVGPGNFVKFSSTHHFSHCSYTELYANEGVIGLSIYVYLMYLFISRQYRYLKRTRDQKFLVFLVIAIIYAFYNIFYVFYVDLWLMGFFMLIASHSLSIYRQYLDKQKLATQHV